MKRKAQPLLLMLMPFRIFQNVITLGCSSLLVFSLNTFSTSVAADYKREFKTSIVVNQENPWGRAAERFADALRYRTQGRIQIKNYSMASFLQASRRPSSHCCKRVAPTSPSIRPSIGLCR
jgi:hypothetical protein